MKKKEIDLNLLIEMDRQGCNLLEMSSALVCSIPVVSKRRLELVERGVLPPPKARHKLRKRPHRNDIPIEKIEDMYINQEMSANQIAKHFNTYSATIVKKLRDNSITIRNSSDAKSKASVGKYIDKYGYAWVRIFPDDGYFLMCKRVHYGKDGKPYSGMILEHRYIAAKYIRCAVLNEGEVVHHINSDKSDNRVENLEIITNQTNHLAITMTVKEKDKVIRQLNKEITELKKQLQ